MGLFDFLKKESRDPDELELQADEALAAGDCATAGTHLEAAAKYSPSTVEKSRLYLAAADALKTVDPAKAVDMFIAGIDLLVARGQMRRAAQHAFEVGAILKQLHDYPNALVWFWKSGDWYAQENATAMANKGYVAYADIAALQGQPVRAAVCYEKAAQQAIGLPTGKWQVKEFLIKAVFSYLLAENPEQAANVQRRLCATDTAFATGGEGRCLLAIVNAIAAEDEPMFEGALYEWDQKQRLDRWMLDAGLALKRRFSEKELL